MKCVFPEDGPCYYRQPGNECGRQPGVECLHSYREGLAEKRRADRKERLLRHAEAMKSVDSEVYRLLTEISEMI